MTPQLNLHTTALLFVLFSMFTGRCITARPKSLLTVGALRLRAGVGVGEILPTPAPTPTPGKTVDSDRLQLRSRLRLRSPGQNLLSRYVLLES